MTYERFILMGRKFAQDPLNKVHGNRFALLLDKDSMKEIGRFDEGLAINIFEDGSLMLTGNRYCSSQESFHEYVIELFEGKRKEEMIKKSTPCLRNVRLYRAAENYS